MKKRLLYLLVILPFIVFSIAHAATYYVAQSSAGDGDGSSYANRASISTFNAGTGVFGTLDGDEVRFCGTITTTIEPADGGTDSNGVTLSGDCSEGGGTDATLSVNDNDEGIILSEDDDYIDVYWFYFVDANPGNYNRSIGIEILGADYCVIKNNYVNALDYGVFIDNNSHHNTIGGSSTQSNLFYAIGDSTDNADIGFDNMPSGNSTTYNTISYNELDGKDSDNNIGSDGIVCENPDRSYVSNNTIEYNYIHHHSRENEIDLKGGDEWTVRGNILVGDDNEGGVESIIHFQQGVSNVYLYGNVLRGSAENAVAIFDNSDSGKATDNVNIWSNLIYDNHDTGISRDENYDGCGEVQIWNNTIVDNGTNPETSNVAGFQMFEPAGSGEDITVLNNIIAYNRDGDGTQPTKQVHTLGTANFSFDYNLYESDDGDVDIYYDGALRDFDTYWQTTASQDANGTETDPGFTDRANDDYTTTANLTGTSSSVTAYHTDADKGIESDSSIDPVNCGQVPDGAGGSQYAQCSEISLVDRDSYNGGTWGKGAFVYNAGGEEGPEGNASEYSFSLSPSGTQQVDPTGTYYIQAGPDVGVAE